MPSIIRLSDGSELEVPDDAHRVQQQIQKLSREPLPYGDWIGFGDKDQTYINPAHIVSVRDGRKPDRTLRAMD
jgi:hypothetical protein